MSGKRPIMVMAGGTGGHVFPALAVANFLREQGESIIWMGTRNGIESRLVPQAGFAIEWLEVQGLRGKGLLAVTLAPFKLMQACWQAMKILRRNRPRAVLGMGGFAAGPGGLMAWVLRIPLIIHEQNAVIGLTNKLLKGLARISYFAFPQAAAGVSKSQVVGNPVRADILSIAHPQQRLAGREHQKIRLLIIGGSLGARTLNEVVPAAMAKLPSAQRPEIRHQCGERNLQACQDLYKQLQVDAEVLPFVDDMKAAYEWADLVLCRAGALTVSELAAAGMASILVPYPYAVDDHQYLNALYLASADAAILVRDHVLTPDHLNEIISRLGAEREQILKMSIKARSLAYTEATQQVAQGILQEARV
jgi:UDP-N-acetylglucosamine--N-acetylmuramyl-(pentapeptide) pyrophosphoryl-undecaprenol N-acetylglucosamine transferase